MKRSRLFVDLHNSMSAYNTFVNLLLSFLAPFHSFLSQRVNNGVKTRLGVLLSFSSGYHCIPPLSACFPFISDLPCSVKQEVDDGSISSLFVFFSLHNIIVFLLLVSVSPSFRMLTVQYQTESGRWEHILSTWLERRQCTH
jgi:hypothetical protein